MKFPASSSSPRGGGSGSRGAAYPSAQVLGEMAESVMSAPASVEDHFAKALGDQWSKVKNSSSGSSPQNTTVAT